jgi:hypothetical protein
MTRTIDDLREMFDGISAPVPDNHDRMVEVQRRIRRGTRRRVTAQATMCVTILAMAGVVVSQLHDDRSEPLPVARDSGPLPSSFSGMPRIALRQYSVTGKNMRIEFTPTGKNTTIIVRCRPGYQVWVGAADESGGGDCQPSNQRIGGRIEYRPGSLSISGPGSGYLKPGKRAVIQIVVFPSSAHLDNAVQPQDAVHRYLATNPPGTSPWTVAVYSGHCMGKRYLCP